MAHLGAKYKTLGHAKTKAYTGGAGADRSRKAIILDKRKKRMADEKEARGGRTVAEHKAAVAAHEKKTGAETKAVRHAQSLDKYGKPKKKNGSTAAQTKAKAYAKSIGSGYLGR
jgi:hypothetical protein